MRPLVAHCHLGLGTLSQRTAKPEQAREHLTAAATMYRDMGMLFWLAQAQTPLTELRRRSLGDHRGGASGAAPSSV